MLNETEWKFLCAMEKQLTGCQIEIERPDHLLMRGTIERIEYGVDTHSVRFYANCCRYFDPNTGTEGSIPYVGDVLNITVREDRIHFTCRDAAAGTVFLPEWASGRGITYVQEVAHNPHISPALPKRQRARARFTKRDQLLLTNEKIYQLKGLFPLLSKHFIELAFSHDVICSGWIESIRTVQKKVEFRLRGNFYNRATSQPWMEKISLVVQGMSIENSHIVFVFVRPGAFADELNLVYGVVHLGEREQVECRKVAHGLVNH